MRSLHPNLEHYLAQFNQAVALLIANGFKATPTNAREGLANLTRQFVTHIPEISRIQDDIVPTGGYPVPIRIYHPDPDQTLPILVYYHGGGHMAGSVSVYDPICRKLAIATRHVVIAVEYRLAPECPYPAAIEDAYQVLKNIYPVLDQQNIRYRKHLSIGGDSGGGALAATVAQRAQFDVALAIQALFLIYPSVDYTMNTPAIEENATGYLLQKGKISWYFDHYFARGEDRKAASPLHGTFTDRHPRTLMITAEFCPLRDEGQMYAAKLAETGVKVQSLHFEDMIHTFVNLEDLVPEACAKLYQTIANFLNQEH